MYLVDIYKYITKLANISRNNSMFFDKLEDNTFIFLANVT